jgi:hypothetical protein
VVLVVAVDVRTRVAPDRADVDQDKNTIESWPDYHAQISGGTMTPPHLSLQVSGRAA